MIVVPSNLIRKDGFYIKISDATKNPFSPKDSHHLRGISLNSDGNFFELNNSFDFSIKDRSFGGLQSLLDLYIKEAKGLIGKPQGLFTISYNVKSLVASQTFDYTEYSIICTLYQDDILSIETFIKDTDNDEIDSNASFITKFISFQQINTLTTNEIFNQFFLDKKKSFWTRFTS